MRRARSYAIQGVEPAPYAAVDLVSDRAKGAQAFHCGPFGLDGIVKRPMERLERERKQARTAVLGLIGGWAYASWAPSASRGDASRKA
jgi:hypothetical protein